MQLRQALQQGITELEKAAIGQARLQAEVLLSHLLGCDRAYLFAHPERELTNAEQTSYKQLIKRRAAGEPLQYLTGRQEFWKADFEVTPAVLIPRPETEHLIETVLGLVCKSGGDAGGAGLKLIDVGTGSGAIAVALACELPQADVWAVELSNAALEVARRNAERLLSGEDGARVHFLQGDLLSAVERDGSFDFVVSNPPYVAEGEAREMQREVVGHEPAMALFAGVEGLDVIRRLIPQAAEALAPGGWLVMEIGFGQEDAVRLLLRDWREVKKIADLSGIARIIAARRPA